MTLANLPVDMRQLPHDGPSEEAVLGSLLIDGAAIAQVKHFLKPEHFYSKINGSIYRACIELKARSEAIDEITVATELARRALLEECGGEANLVRMKTVVPTSLDLENYAQIVFRMAVSRDIIASAVKAGEIGYSADPDPNKALDQFVDLANKCRQKNTRLNRIITPQQEADLMISTYVTYEDDDTAGDPIPYGFKVLDALTLGMYPNELIILGARPSVGKTQIMLDIKNNIVANDRNKIILWVSAEMSMEQIIEREVARELGITVKELREAMQKAKKLNTPIAKEWRDKIMRLAGAISKGQVHFMAEGTSSEEIYVQAQKLKETIGLHGVFVDYIQRLSDVYQGPGDNMAVKVGKISKVMKAIAKDFNVFNVVASQLSRESEKSEDKIPRMSQLRYSGDIEQDADTIFLAHRDTANPGTLFLYNDKHRQYGAADKPLELLWSEEGHRYIDKPVNSKAAKQTALEV